MKNFYKTYLILLSISAMIISGISCKKQDDWLNAKRLKGDVTPQTIADYQAILDFNTQINNYFINLGLLGTDNLYIKDVNFAGLTEEERDVYLWQKNMWDSQNGISYEWNNMFSVIEDANIVLDGLAQIDSKTAGYNNLKGEALFYRSICYYNLAQLFCRQYDSKTATSDLGLPIRLSSDVNIIYQRSTLQQLYDQMLADGKQASALLDEVPLFTRRPGKYAAFSLLAKIDLDMENYKDAGKYANDVLAYNATLLDFNSDLIVPSSTYRFPANGIGNPEILFFAQCSSYNSIRPSSKNTSFIDSTFFNSYSDNDLRKSLFYIKSGTGYKFRGAYTGNIGTFCGIATNELYLIRAESNARQGNAKDAIDDINTLLSKRFKTGTFNKLSAMNSDDALKIILQERRKELPFTGLLRWEDLRRLNKDSRFQVAINRVINGQTTTLLPNGSGYVFPIPPNEVQLTGIQQN